MNRYDTGLGHALAEANVRLEQTLVGLGLLKKAKKGKKQPLGDVFEFDPVWMAKEAKIGASLAGEHTRVAWTPMSVINAMAAANRPPPTPMSEETKVHLRAIGKLKPHDNGDPAARLLRDCKDQDEVYEFTAKYCKVKEADLRAKYEKLNPGQRKMCCANRVRAQWKKLHPVETVE